MSKRSLSYLILPILILITGCKSVQDHDAKPGEGMITYSISYPDSSKYGLKAAFFPKSITLVFKDDKAAFIASAGMGMIQLVDLLDYKNQKFTSLLIDNLRENLGCKLTKEDIYKNEHSAEYEFETTGEEKVIAGITCNKAKVTDKSNHSSFDLFYVKDIRFNYWNSPFKDFKHLFLEYSHTINNLTMKLVATQVDLKTPVDTTLFEVKGNYRWLNQDQFYKRLGEL